MMSLAKNTPPLSRAEPFEPNFRTSTDPRSLPESEHSLAAVSTPPLTPPGEVIPSSSFSPNTDTFTLDHGTDLSSSIEITGSLSPQEELLSTQPSTVYSTDPNTPEESCQVD